MSIRNMLNSLRMSAITAVMAAALVAANGGIAHAITLTLSSTVDGTPTVADGFGMPTGLATDGTDIFMADYGNGVIYKITTTTKAVTTIVASITKPVAIAYRPAGGAIAVNAIFVVTEGSGVKVFNASTGAAVAPTSFGTGFSGVDTYKNIINPVDIALDNTNDRIYVLDAYVDANGAYKYVAKGFTATTGAWFEYFPGDGNNGTALEIDATFNNGMLSLPTTMAFYKDGTNPKFIIGDTGNTSSYMRMTQLCNRKGCLAPSTTFSGTPRGKVQVFVQNGGRYKANSSATSTGENASTIVSNMSRQFVLQGTDSGSGLTSSIAGIVADGKYLFILDPLANKILVYGNPAVDSTAVLLGAKPAAWAPVTQPFNANITNDIAGQPQYGFKYVNFYGAFTPSSQAFSEIKDAVLIGTTTLVVSDTQGRVYYYTIGGY